MATWLPGLATGEDAERAQPGRPWAALLGALPDFGLAGSFLLAWILPLAVRPTMVRELTQLMVLEFIVMHSSMLMFYAAISRDRKRSKALMLIGMSAIYSLFAIGFSLSFHSWWPFASFWLLTANRLATVLLGGPPDGRAQTLAVKSWLVSGISYLVGAVVTAGVPLPALGITPAVIARQGFTGSGVWIEEPWRCLAFGVFYFGLQGLSGVADFFLISRWQRKGEPENMDV